MTTIPEVAPLVWDLYASEHGGCGGCLHIVLDDGNVEDRNVLFCVEEAKREGCGQCLPIAELMLSMTETQRTKLYRLALADSDEQVAMKLAWGE